MLIEYFLKKALDDVNVGNNIQLEVSDSSNNVLSAKVFENKIVWSESNFIDLYFLIHEYMEKKGLDLSHNVDTYYMVSRCCLAHEVGHLIDKTAKIRLRRRNRIAEKFNKKPTKRLLNKYYKISLRMETSAWNKIEKKLNIEDEKEREIFYLVKDFGLNSYINKKEAV